MARAFRTLCGLSFLLWSLTNSLPAWGCQQQGPGCQIINDFNSSSIPAGDTIWFSAVVTVKGVHVRSAQLLFNSTITYTVHGVQQTVTVPTGEIDFSSTTYTASTTFNSSTNTWVTAVPSSTTSTFFVTGVAVQVPAGGYPGNIQPVKWTGSWEANANGITVQWQGSAAVYRQFSTDYNALGVKAVGDNHTCGYHNSDQAGVPENYKQYVTYGANGTGGSNWTGTRSGALSCPVGNTPPPPRRWDPTLAIRPARLPCYRRSPEWSLTLRTEAGTPALRPRASRLCPSSQRGFQVRSRLPA
jgi:hypothetical protein